MDHSCEQYSQIITRWLDAELTTDETGDLHAHIQKCPTCQRELAQQKKIRQLWEDPPSVTSYQQDRDAIVAAANKLHTAGESDQWQETRGGLLHKQVLQGRFNLFGLLAKPKRALTNLVTVTALAASIFLGVNLAGQLTHPEIAAGWDNASPVFTLTEYQVLQAGGSIPIAEDVDHPF